MSVGATPKRRRRTKIPPELKRRYDLQHRYRITPEEWEALFEWQGRVCAACGSDNPGNMKGWVLDHCHGTGLIRGILCSGCNLALGHAAHDPTRLELLTEYIKQYLDQFTDD